MLSLHGLTAELRNFRLTKHPPFLKGFSTWVKWRLQVPAFFSIVNSCERGNVLASTYMTSVNQSVSQSIVHLRCISSPCRGIEWEKRRALGSFESVFGSVLHRVSAVCSNALMHFTTSCVCCFLSET